VEKSVRLYLADFSGSFWLIDLNSMQSTFAQQAKKRVTTNSELNARGMEQQFIRV